MKTSPLLQRTASLARARSAQGMMEHDTKLSTSTTLHERQLERALANIPEETESTPANLVIVSPTSMPPLTVKPKVVAPFVVPSFSSSPLTKLKTPNDFTQGVVTDAELDSLGSDVSKEVTELTDQIIGKMTLDRFAGLGDIMAGIELQMKGLSPESLEGFAKPRWFGFVERSFGEVRKLWIEHFQTADKGFEIIKNTMHTQIATHEKWIKDLDTLYDLNYDKYNKVVTVIKLGERWEKAGQSVMEAWPKIEPDDPDGPMKLQFKTDSENRLNRLGIKLDFFRRLKVITELNGPKIRSQQQTSRSIIQCLNDQLTQGIPLIKDAFMTQLQNLDALKGVGAIENGRNLTNQSLQTAAKSTTDAAIASTKALNTALISNQTMDEIRQQGLRALTSISEIQTQAQKQRQIDAQAMMESQKQYLIQLQAKGAI
jgi:uncharacterized protein YaaN involved in tellurite resistance